MTEDTTEVLAGAIRVDEQQLRGHIDEAVRSSVEETLNGLLEAEADAICGAGCYERSADRVDTRAGHYERKLETRAGEVQLKVPKLRSLPFETAIIERYRRREASVEEALVEMYLAGVSVRRVEDITEALWGTRVSSGTVSRLNQKIYRHIEAWRTRRIEGEFAYLYLDGVVLKRSWAGEVRNVSVLVAIGVGADGFRQILGVAEGQKEDLEGWRGFLRYLKERGLRCSVDHFRRLPGPGRSGHGALRRCSVATLHRSLVQERLQPCAPRQSRRSRAHAQGDSRPGGSRLCAGENPRGRDQAQSNAVTEGRGAGGWQGPRDAHIFCVPEQSLAADPNEQSTRAHHPRDPPPHARCRRLSGRSQRVDARGCKAAPHRINALGKAALSCDGDTTQARSPGGSLKTRPGYR